MSYRWTCPKCGEEYVVHGDGGAACLCELEDEAVASSMNRERGNALSGKGGRPGVGPSDSQPPTFSLFAWTGKRVWSGPLVYDKKTGYVDPFYAEFEETRERAQEGP